VDPPVALFAKEQGLPVLQPAKASALEFLEALRQLEIDVIITCAYGQILSTAFLEIPKRATINIHPSALPQYRGATPIPAALLAGDNETAVTVLFTVKALDAGAIILQQPFPILPEETTGILSQRLFSASGPLVVEALACLQDPSFTGHPQDEARVTLCQKISKEAGLVDWTLPSHVIHNRFRAFSPWPGTYTYLQGKRITLEAMHLLPVEKSDSTIPGTFHYDKATKSLRITCNDVCELQVTQLKSEGGKSVSAESFWNGLRDKTHVQFTRNEK